MELSQLKQLVHAACKNNWREIVDGASGHERSARIGQPRRKSSAGDKYETGRAMAQIERDKAATQVAEALKMKEALSRINPEKRSSSVEIGSLVQTDKGYCFVGIAVGKLMIDGMECLAISTASPIGKLMIGKQLGDSVAFNEQTFVIQAVC